ncbi:ParB/RepB/Spo0J family partition protein [Boudabousia marimammalium]|uniref:ParB-like N-terminal domain-containing protein n=1 Tax=Boudabousia marimammalium TaxID=156892 RepID=A0A1Q5PSL7_9ACTO|nr:ParB/RepB/Spo0J family partition protein [Boudabousia marimammalium]OKL50567.1 hypothetical protein BM477_00975 [Boudabousia marimammalium]
MSQKKRGGLGRGLSALIPESQREEVPTSAGSPLDVFFSGNVSREILSGQDEITDSVTKNAAQLSQTKDAARSLLSAPAKSQKRRTKKKATAPKPAKAGTKTPRPQAHDEPVKSDNQAAAETIVSRETIAEKAGEKGQYGPVLYGILPDSEESGEIASSQSAQGLPDTETEAEAVELAPVPGATFGEIPIWAIVANRAQPRTEFSQHELSELVDSISEVGVLQPIVVRPLPEAEQQELFDSRLAQARKRELFAYHNADSLVKEMDEAARENGDLEKLLSVADVKRIGPPRYELIMGERRLRAARLAGVSAIPAIVRRTEDQDVLRDALLENLHRVQLNPIEEAAAYQQLMDDFSCTQEVLAKKVARSRPQIANMLRLLRLPGSIQNKVAAGTLSTGHARAILGLSRTDDQIHLAERVIKEQLSVRATEKIAAQGNPLASPHAKATRPRSVEHLPEQIEAFATKFGDALDTRVNVQMGKKKCKIVIEAADYADLERLIQILEAQN